MAFVVLVNYERLIKLDNGRAIFDSLSSSSKDFLVAEK